MGKLGARELNYSSDVDLVLLYDPAAPIYTDAPMAMRWAASSSRIARGLVSLMEARDADGYVFRTDLRLRPDPAVTPPAVALPAAITYYESMGQNWERAAMIKARPVAGDLALGAAFLEAIRPFVWRRGLDFAAVADIHAMKRRIDEHKGGALADAARPAGAHRRPQREAGRRRHPRDRVPGADPAAGLGRPRSGAARPARRWARCACWCAPATCRAVPRANWRAAYRFLRRVEHRLQMTADRQMHELPQRPAELARFATFMGYADAGEFAAAAAAPPATRCGRATPRCSSWCRSCWRPPSGGLELDFRGVDAAPEATDAALRALGFGNPGRIVTAVRGWQAGHVRALRSARARELLAQLLPRVLAALARQPQPDAVFNRFDAFLARQPAGVQLLSLFQRNPGLLDRIAAVLGAAPSLADHLASHPAALDGLLSPEENAEPGAAAARPAARCAAAGGCHRDHPPHGARGGFFHLGRHDGGADRRR